MKQNIKKTAVVGAGFCTLEVANKIRELEVEGFEVVEVKELTEDQMPLVEKIEMPTMDFNLSKSQYMGHYKAKGSKYHK